MPSISSTAIKLDPDYALETLQGSRPRRGGDAGAVRHQRRPHALGGGRNRRRPCRSAVDIPLGIHTHNDGECAVANSLAAVRAGCIQVQGTINGYGERCGNANLCSIIPDLELKLGLHCPAGRQAGAAVRTLAFCGRSRQPVPGRAPGLCGQSGLCAQRRHPRGRHAPQRQSYQHIDPAWSATRWKWWSPSFPGGQPAQQGRRIRHGPGQRRAGRRGAADRSRAWKRRVSPSKPPKPRW